MLIVDQKTRLELLHNISPTISANQDYRVSDQDSTVVGFDVKLALFQQVFEKPRDVSTQHTL